MKKERKKTRKRRSYSLFLIPQDHSRVHKIHLTPRLITLMTGATVAALLFLIFNVIGFWYYRGVTSSLIAQKGAFEEYRKEKTELTRKVALLEETVKETEKYATQLGALVGTTTPPMTKGIGPVRTESFSVEAATEPVTLATVEPKVDGLQKRAKELQSKIQELYKTQKDHLNFVAATPSLWPVKGWVTSDFGMRRSPFGYRSDFHAGMDIAAQWGTPVVASADGVVTMANYKGGLGKTVMIDHGFGVKSVYGHNSSILVQEGQRIRKGTPVALVGSTGHSTGPHCHFEVHVDGVAVDPMRYLMGSETAVADIKKPRSRKFYR